MSRANVELVRRCYEVWNSRDWSQVPDLIDPKAEFDLSRNVFNPDVYRGQAGLERLTRTVDDVWDDLVLAPTEFIDAGNDVVVGVTVRGRGRESGVEVHMELFSVWTLRDAKVVRMRGGYRDRAEALSAAAASE